jgi:tetratricopeptide (TPR) repeat protein
MKRHFILKKKQSSRNRILTSCVFVLLLLCFLFADFYCNTLFAQSNLENELLADFEAAKDDSTRAEIQYALAVVSEDDTDKSLEYAKKSFLYAQKSNVRSVMAKAGIFLSHVYIAQNEHSTAIRYLLQAFRAYEKYPNSDTRANIAIELGTFYQNLDAHEKALEYFNIAYQIVEKRLNERTLLIELIGYSYIALAKYDEALAFYKKILPVYEKNNNVNAQISTHRKIINIYKLTDRQAEALENNLKILNLYESAGHEAGIASTCNNLGYTHRFLKEYDKSIFYFNKALQAADKLGIKDEQATCFVNLAITYQNKNDFSSAVKNLNKALDIRIKEGNSEKIAQTYLLFSELYLKQKDLYQAFRFAKEALHYAEKTKKADIRKDIYLTTSDIYQNLDDFKNALVFYREYLRLKDSLVVEERILREKNDRKQFDLEKTEKELKLFLADEELKTLEKDLAFKQMEIERERTERELENLKKDKELQRSQLMQRELEKDRAMKALLLTEQRLAAARKDNEISLLQKSKQEQELELKQKEIQEKEKQQQIIILENAKKLNEIQLKDQEEERKYIFGLLFLAFCVLILIIAGYLAQRKNNRVLAKQNKEIQEQRDLIQMKSVELQQQSEEIEAQRDTLIIKTTELDLAYRSITDSVRYASRIQGAMMPERNLVYAAFTDVFILYLPKDIVSGDFFWFLEKDGAKYIAAADCTGHGVPGALMSMLGASMLNEIVNLRNIEKPAAILDELHNSISGALKQDTTDNRDGMDISLAKIEQSPKVVQLAAAKNPVFVIKNDELTVIKGDKMPVGGRARYADEPYQNHEVSFEDAPLRVYLFSDGYQDQFGGSENRKFMVKRMREMIFDMHKKPMLEQEHILEKEIKQWMGDASKQTDDILVLGFTCT